MIVYHVEKVTIALMKDSETFTIMVISTDALKDTSVQRVLRNHILVLLVPMQIKLFLDHHLALMSVKAVQSINSADVGVKLLLALMEPIVQVETVGLFFVQQASIVSKMV